MFQWLNNLLFKYTEVRNFKEGLACVKSNGKWGFIDETGKEVIPLKYDLGFDFKEGFAEIENNTINLI